MLDFFFIIIALVIHNRGKIGSASSLPSSGSPLQESERGHKAVRYPVGGSQAAITWIDNYIKNAANAGYGPFTRWQPGLCIPENISKVTEPAFIVKYERYMSKAGLNRTKQQSVVAFSTDQGMDLCGFADS